MKKLPISVFIITKNEEDRVPDPILSVKNWVDEVLVVDSGSTDNTLEVAKSLGAKAVYNEWKGYGPQKLFSQNLCKNDWVFNIDADEEITPEMRDEIIEIFEKGDPGKVAFYVKRKMLFSYEDTPPLFAPADYFLRLYNRNYASYDESTVHDVVHVKEGETKTLKKGIMLHRCFRSYAHWADKINFYSSMQAEDRFNKGKKVSVVRIILEPFISFFKSYILRRYFVYGVDGFIHSVIYAYARLMRFAKTRELYQQAAYTAKKPKAVEHKASEA